MCHRCDKEVIDMGILESDLPNLPFKNVWWHCMVSSCRGKAKLRDYGIAPIYFWPVKITRTDKWRGGWTNLDHGYICGKHFPQYELDPEHFIKKYLYDILELRETEKMQDYLSSRIEPIKKQK